MPDEPNGRKRYRTVEGVRLKFRTEECDERRIATATIWVNDEPLQVIATLDLDMIERPGDPAYQGWVDSIGTAFQGFLSRLTGIDALATKRQKADYKGEG